jgi:hypothetical protein
VTTARTFAEQLRRWRASAPLRTHAGEAARALVAEGLGADARAWALVAGLLPPAAADAHAPAG